MGSSSLAQETCGVSRGFTTRLPSRVQVVTLCLLLCSACRTPEQKAAEFIRHGKALAEQKDYNRAVLEFQNAVKAAPNDAEPFYQLGRTYLSIGNPRLAVPALKKATELNPKHAAAQLALAELMAQSSNKDVVRDAKKRAQAVVAQSPEDSDAAAVFARAEIGLGNFDEAEKQLKRTLAKVPNNVKASVELADLKLSRRDVQGAEDALKAALAAA